MGALVADGGRDADVIVAPATPPGASALAVVRLTGPPGAARDVALRLAPALDGAPPATARLATLLDAEGAPLDEAVVLWFEAPRSPTGEEVVEISCHGSPAVVRGLLVAARQAGARQARPGEFSRRALRNGKLDLVEAEGVARLAAAESRGAARRALGLVRGDLSRRLEAIAGGLLDLLAGIEARLDFPEDDVPEPPAPLAERLGALEAELLDLAGRGERGALLDRLPVVAITGAPNAGKSTLFNALVGSDRAIVTEVPGTTRDVLSETVELGGERVRLLDTAGLRETAEKVERIGVEAALRAAAGADLVLQLVDGASGAGALRAEGAREASLTVVTKRDLWAGAAPAVVDGSVAVSAVTGEGLDALRREIARRLGLAEADGELLVLERHRAALSLASLALGEARALCASAAGPPPEELVASALREALHRLGEITGETATEELLDRVFSTFCIGK